MEEGVAYATSAVAALKVVIKLSYSFEESLT